MAKGTTKREGSKSRKTRPGSGRKQGGKCVPTEELVAKGLDRLTDAQQRALYECCPTLSRGLTKDFLDLLDAAGLTSLLVKPSAVWAVIDSLKKALNQKFRDDKKDVFDALPSVLQWLFSEDAKAKAFLKTWLEKQLKILKSIRESDAEAMKSIQGGKHAEVERTRYGGPSWPSHWYYQEYFEIAQDLQPGVPKHARQLSLPIIRAFGDSLLNNSSFECRSHMCDIDPSRYNDYEFMWNKFVDVFEQRKSSDCSSRPAVSTLRLLKQLLDAAKTIATK